MANVANLVDFDTPLATWLASSIGGGTWADVIQQLKIDGRSRTAQEQKNYPAQLWGNIKDDFFLRAYEVFEGNRRVPGLVAGVLEARPYVAGDETPMLRFAGNGANSAEIEFYAGTRNPNGNVTARPGDVYVRKSGAASELWINVSPGATGSVWSGTAGANPWAQVLANGAESGGTDPEITEPDALTWIDGEGDPRVRAWLDGDDWRIDVHGEAGALVGTWSFDTLTGDLDAGANNIANAGTYNGVTVEAHGSRHAAAGADPVTLAADSRVLGRAAGAGAGAVQELTGDQLGAILDAAAEYVRRDGTLALTAPWDAGAFTITADGLVIDGAAPRITIGDYTAPGFLDFDKPAASEMAIAWHSNDAGPATRWEDALISDESRRFRAYDSASALLHQTIIDNATHLWTYPASAIYSSASPSVQVGNGAGSPQVLSGKSDAGQASFPFYSNSLLRGQFTFESDESFRWRLYSVAEVLEFTTTYATGTGRWTFPSQIVIAAPAALLYVGSDGGTPEVWIAKAEASEGRLNWASVGVARFQGALTATEDHEWRTFSAAAALLSTTTVDNATGSWHFPEDLFQNSATAYFEMGYSNAQPVRAMLKADASTAYDSWLNGVGFTPVWSAWLFASDEDLMAERTGVNVPLRFDAATQLTTLADATVAKSSPSVVSTVGDGTGTPHDDPNKGAAGEYYGDLKSASVREWLFPYFTSAEKLSIERWTGGAGINAALSFNASATQAAATTTLSDGTILHTYPNVLGTWGDSTGSPATRAQKSAGGDFTDTLYSDGVRRWILTDFTSLEDLQTDRYSSAGAFVNAPILFATADTLAATATHFFDATINFGHASPIKIHGDGTGSPTDRTQKTEAGTINRYLRSNGVDRILEQLDPSEDFGWYRYTAGSALETQLNLFAGGLVYAGTHLAIADAITVPAATAGMGKFCIDSAANGRPKLVEADGAIEQLGVGIDSQAMPVVHTDISEDTLEDTAETDVLNYTIPASAMGATGIVFAKIAGIHVAASSTLRLRIYLDASLVIDTTSPTLAESGDHAFRCEFYVCNRTTSTQVVDGRVELSAADTAAVGYASWDEAAGTPYEKATSFVGVASEDTTAATVLRVTLTQSTATLTEIYTRHVQLAAAA